MAGYDLLRSQERDLFDAIKRFELDPSKFKWTHNDSDSSTTLQYKGTDYYFRFEQYQESPEESSYTIITFSPGETRPVVVANVALRNWPDQWGHFRDWLKYLKRELETKNPWKDIFEQKELSDASTMADTENTPFTSDEASLISSQLAELKDLFIAKSLIDEEYHEVVESRLKYLEHSSNKLGRVDWANIVYATVIQLAVGKVLDSTTFQTAVEWMRNLFQKISVGTRYLPPF